MTELDHIEKFLTERLKSYELLQVVADTDQKFEVWGTIPAMQGKKKVEGHYFASVIRKPKDIRLYYFPIYTHPELNDLLSPELSKCLKGKSCFHIKKMDESMQEEIAKLMDKGVATYQEHGLI